jgi:hypothetical protein
VQLERGLSRRKRKAIGMSSKLHVDEAEVQKDVAQCMKKISSLLVNPKVLFLKFLHVQLSGRLGSIWRTRI